MRHEIYLTKEQLQKIQNGETICLYIHHIIKFNDRIDIKLGENEKLKSIEQLPK